MEVVEKINVKPSIEIIPDEYRCFEGENNEKILVYTFCSSSSESQNKVKYFEKSLGQKYFEVTECSLENDNCKEVLINSTYVSLKST